MRSIGNRALALSVAALAALVAACSLFAPSSSNAPAAAPATSAAPAARPEPAPADKWDLTAIYPTTADWDKDLKAADGQMKAFEGCRGKLGESAKRFRQCVDLYFDLDKRLNRLNGYASLSHDEDTRVSANLELVQKVQLAQTRASEATSFFSPEILAVGHKKIDAFIAAEPALKIYAHPLDDVLRRAPHTLDAKGEALVATLGLTRSVPSDVYEILTFADIPWPTLKVAGEDVRLDQAAYTKYRAVPDRDERKQVFDTFWGRWKDYERTLGVALYGQVKNDVANAKVRNYTSARASALDGARIPEKVYDTLVEQAEANLGTLHRYFKLRAKMLGISDLRYYDIYPPLVKSDQKFPLARGKQLVLDAVAPLGADYVSAMNGAFNGRWMDVYPKQGKRAGAYMNPAAYDVHPFLLLNYNDDYESATTLAHEGGHAMHSFFANKAQPYPTANYSIFTAEIASTVNEALLLEHVLKTAQSDDEKLYYLGTALEGLRGTYFRQTMFAEFERDIHSAVEKGDTLTGESLSKHYCELLKRYHGHDQHVLTIDDKYCVEWAYIPHFYGNFYVYQYATSIAAASLFAQRILAGEPGAKEKYLGVLKAGGAEYPYELVKAAGVDLGTPAPHQALYARMNKIMDQIEAILAKREKK